MLKFYAAKSEDIPLIQALENEACISSKEQRDGFVINAYTEEELLKFIHNDCVSVGKIDERIVAYSVYGPLHSYVFSYLHELWSEIAWSRETPSIQSSNWLERMVVKEGFRGKGVGGEILSFLRNKDTKNKILTAVAQKPMFNAGALQFYLKNSFEVHGRYRSNNFRGLKNYESVVLISNN